MAFGNVIPIDADVARQLARRQLRFRWLVAGLTALWIAITIPALVLTPLPPLAPFIALAALVVLAEHRFVLFGDETSMSASIVVVVASVFVFTDTSPLAGPILIASIGGIYLPHLRTRAFSKIAFNGAGMGIAAGCAALVARAPWLSNSSSLGLTSTALIAVVAYWVANNLVVACHQVTLCGAEFLRSARLLIGAETDVLPWAVASCMGVIAASGNEATGIAFIASIAALRIVAVSSAYDISRVAAHRYGRQNASLFWLSTLALMTHNGSVNVTLVAACATVALVIPMHHGHSRPVIAVTLPLLAVAALGAGLGASAIALAAALILVTLTRKLSDAWSYSVTAGIAILAVWSNIQQIGFLPATNALLGTAIVSLSTLGIFAFKTFRTARSIGPWTAVGLALPGSTWIGTVVFVPAIALAAVNEPVLALGLATGALVLRGVSPLSDQRSPVAASH